MQLLPFCIRNKFWFKWNDVASHGFSSPCLLTCRHDTLTLCSPGLSLNSHVSWVHSVLCLGASQMLHVNGEARNAGYSRCACLLCSWADSTVPSHFTYKLKFQGKITKNLKMVTVEQSTQHSLLLNVRSLYSCELGLGLCSSSRFKSYGKKSWSYHILIVWTWGYHLTLELQLSCW